MLDLHMIGKRIREAREAAKLKQAELARRVGVQPISIYKIESGRSTPGLQLLTRIATELGVSIDSLVFDESELEQPNRAPSEVPPPDDDDDDNTAPCEGAA